MGRNIVSTIFGWALACLTIPCYAATLWAMNTFVSEDLVTIDTTTGAVAVVGTVPGDGVFGGLDFDAAGNLYVLRESGLYRMDAMNPAGVLVGVQPGQLFESFEIIGNKGYAADLLRTRSLYEIDLATGAATVTRSPTCSMERGYFPGTSFG